MLFLLSQVLLQKLLISLEGFGALGWVLLKLLPCYSLRVIFHTLLISAHKAVMSERKKIL